jgi:hypothetical protein
MKISRSQFFQLVAGGSAWLVSSGFAQKIKLAVADAARPLPLTAVRLTGGPLKKAQDLDAAYLLSLDPDRMLAFYRKRAGLAQKAEGYTGWDADGRQLTGHIAGHHLSAVSLMYSATGDARFRQRADYLVAEIKACQDANGDGFAGALPGVKEAFAEVSKGNIKAANFDLNGLWSPWYTLHKTFAGLRDAYRHTGNETALAVAVNFAGWAEKYLAPMDDATIQRMLACEFGGMNEMMADLFADTGDKRWLDLSYKFEHKAVLDPLKHGDDPLSSLHGNTQVPKLVGSAVALRLRRQQGRSDCGDRVLGSRRQSPHLRNGRPRQGRILPRARQAGQHHRRTHGGDLQRLQHAEADAEAVRVAARHPLRGVPRARAVQSHPRLDGQRRWRDVLHGAPSDQACAANTRTCIAASPAASAPAWKVTRFTVWACTTRAATSCM